MSCTNCPGGVVTSVLDYTSVQEPYSVLSHGDTIPVKVGEPLSSACERATIIGQIPEVVRYPNFTVSAGMVVAGVPSNGGIKSMASFFKGREGCYEDPNARLASTCC